MLHHILQEEPARMRDIVANDLESCNASVLLPLKLIVHHNPRPEI